MNFLDCINMELMWMINHMPNNNDFSKKTVFFH